MKKEPAVIISTLTAFLTALIGLGLAFGLNISQEQQDAMLKMLAATVTLIAFVGPIIRQFVFAPDTVDTIKEEAQDAVVTAYKAKPGVEPMPRIQGVSRPHSASPQARRP